MGERKKRHGDRNDGRLLRSLNAFYGLIPFIMQRRSDAQNYFEDKIDVTEANRYLRQKRLDGEKNMSFLHLFIAAYVRTVSQMPALNRFISGQRIYARNNIEMVMSVKKTMSVEGDETTIKTVLDPADTLSDVYRKIDEQVAAGKRVSEDTSTDKVAAVLMKMPRILLKFAMMVIRFMDYFGLLPKSLLDASPFHGSVIITDLGSLGIGPIYHHIYDLGNLPIFIAFGGKYREYVVNKNGETESHYFIHYKMTTDERICDGYYMAKAFKLMRTYLRDPAKLETPPEKVYEDVD